MRTNDLGGGNGGGMSMKRTGSVDCHGTALRMGMKNCPISKESRSLAFSAVAIWHIISFTRGRAASAKIPSSGANIY